ncbi:hypothetical protein M3Y94_01043600 [Aphelenchoides besseyi]|nr:hypothetical protein M3Y94_01043600 [Aphelenchoides besseyi]
MSSNTNSREFETEISQLVHINDKDECVWNLNPWLRVVNDPKHANYSVSDLVVCGKLRTGKSTLQNHTLRYLAWIAMGKPHDVDWKTIQLKNEFKAAGGRESVTKGIWICPFVIEQQKRIVIVVDVEGAFDPKAKKQSRHALFTIATMLSSTLIYNIKDQIGSDDLQNLAILFKYAHKANGGKKLQNFNFLIRDYMLDENYGFEGGRELMTDLRNEASAESRTHFEIVENSTEELNCCLVPSPQRAGIRSGVVSEMGPDFVQEFSALVEHVVNNLKSKMNCVQSDALANRLPEVFKTGKLPEPEDVYELLFVKPDLDKACIDIRNDTKKSMEQKVTGQDEEEFKSVCDELQNDALVHFERRCGDRRSSTYYAAAKAELIRGMNEYFWELKKLNDLVRSKSFMNQLKSGAKKGCCYCGRNCC